MTGLRLQHGMDFYHSPSRAIPNWPKLTRRLACVGAVLWVLAGCSGEKFPQAYGVYLKDSSGWVQAEQALYNLAPDFQILVFDPRLASGNFDPKSIAALRKCAIVRRVVHQWVDSEVYGYSVAPAHEVVTLTDSVPLSISPVEKKPGMMVIKPGGNLAQGLYALTVLDREFSMGMKMTLEQAGAAPGTEQLDRWTVEQGQNTNHTLLFASKEGQQRMRTASLVDAGLYSQQTYAGVVAQARNGVTEFLSLASQRKQDAEAAVELVKAAAVKVLFLKQLDPAAAAEADKALIDTAGVLTAAALERDRVHTALEIAQTVREIDRDAAAVVVAPAAKRIVEKAKEAEAKGLLNTALAFYEDLASSQFAGDEIKAAHTKLTAERGRREELVRSAVERMLATREDSGAIRLKIPAHNTDGGSTTDFNFCENQLTWRVWESVQKIWWGDFDSIERRDLPRDAWGETWFQARLNYSGDHFTDFYFPRAEERERFCSELKKSREQWQAKYADALETKAIAEPGVAGEKIWVKECPYTLVADRSGGTIQFETDRDETGEISAGATRVEDRSEAEFIRVRTSGDKPVVVKVKRLFRVADTSDEKRLEAN